MALRELILPWASQPQEAVQPASGGALWLPSGRDDGWTRTGTFGVDVAADAGVGVPFSGSQGFSRLTTIGDGIAGGLTFWALARPSSSWGLGTAISLGNTASGNWMRLVQGSGGQWQLGVRADNGNAITITGGYSQGGRADLIVARWLPDNGGLTSDIWVNGNRYEARAGSTQNGPLALNNIAVGFQRRASGTDYFNGVIFGAGMLPYAVSDDSIAGKNTPWEWAVEPQRIWVPVSGGGGGSGVEPVVAPGTSSTALTSPAAQQSQASAPAASSSTTALAAPTGTQTQTGSIAAGASATTGSTPAASQAQAGAVSPATSATAASAPAGQQAHAGAVSGGVSSTSLGAPAASQIQQAIIAAGYSATSGSEPAGTVPGSTAVAPGSSATALSVVSASQVQRGTVSGGVSATTGSSVSATQTQTGGSVSAGVSSTSSTSPAGTQDQAGAVQPGGSTTALSTVSGGASGGPAISPGLSATALATLAATQLQLGIVAAGLSPTLLLSIGTLAAGRRRAAGVPVIRRAAGVPVIRRASDMATVTKAAVLDIEEDDTLVFDYTAHLAAAGGATIASAAVEVDVRSGAAADGAELLDGAHQVSGSTVLVPVAGAGAPADYAVRCVATLSTGKRVPIVMSLPVRRQ